MDNQHRQIRGYRELDANDIDKMNEIKALGERLGTMIAELRDTAGYDQRWVAIANTHLQQGIMAAVRAVAQPTSF